MSLIIIIIIIFKWANPGLFFVYFQSFQTNITIFTTTICEKCPSSIWCWDSNPQPSEHESLPITTRPGLPPLQLLLGLIVFTYLSIGLFAFLTLNQSECLRPGSIN